MAGVLRETGALLSHTWSHMRLVQRAQANNSVYLGPFLATITDFVCWRISVLVRLPQRSGGHVDTLNVSAGEA